MVTGAEAATVAKTGASVIQGVRKALTRPEPEWPDAHEALMELFIILDDWCLSAEESNKAARAVLDARMRSSAPPRSTMRIDNGSNAGPGYVQRATRDIRSVLDPPVPWLQQWRASARRAAARRTLRSMMRIYCPDLLTSFEEAVASRAAWMTQNRERLPYILENPRTPTAELRAVVDQLESSLRSLLTARSGLRRLLQESYPLGSGS